MQSILTLLTKEKEKKICWSGPTVMRIAAALNKLTLMLIG